MESANTRRKRDGSDLISSLPDPILHHILGLLKTKEAVQTCVLSKRWEHLWTSLPSLYFDHADFFPGLRLERDKYPEAREHALHALQIELFHIICSDEITWDRESECQENYEEMDGRYRRYVNFVNAVLLRRKPLPLDVFRVLDDFIWPKPMFLEVFREYSKFSTHLKRVWDWIQYALKHKTRVLHLPRFFLRLGDHYSSLEELYLYGLCEIGRGTINLPRLRKLAVFDGMLSSNELNNLLSGSPILEYLSLDDFSSKCVIKHECLKHLVIVNHRVSSLFVSAPNLLSFFFDGELPFLKHPYNTTLNMPSLKSACLVVRNSSTIRCLVGMAVILCFLATVEFLELHVQCDWHKELPSILRTKFPIFPKLKDVIFAFSRTCCFQMVTWILKSSPNLKKLTLLEQEAHLTYAGSGARTSESRAVSWRVAVPSCKNLLVTEVKKSRSDWMMGQLVYALIDGTKDDWYNLLSKHKSNTRPF